VKRVVKTGGQHVPVIGSAGRPWTLWTSAAAVAVITAAVAAAGCSTAACTAHSAGPAAGESVPLATAHTDRTVKSPKKVISEL